MKKEEKIKQAWLHGYVVPEDSPDFLLPVDTSALPKRGGKVLLEDVVSLLGRLSKEAWRLGGDEGALAALIDVACLPSQVALVAIDIERGRGDDLPLGPPPDSEQEKCDAQPAEITNEPHAPGMSDGPPETARDPDANSSAAGNDGPLLASPADATQLSKESAVSQIKRGGGEADDEPNREAALWRAFDILNRFAAGELQTYEEMEAAITAGPSADVTRRYVATVRATDPDIVTARGLLRWTGLDGVRDPLPLQAVAGVNVRCWDVNEKTARGLVQVLHLHANSRQYADLLDPAATNRTQLDIEVNVPDEAARSLLEIAMPKGWSIRVVLSIARKLLTPQYPVFTITHAELPPHLPPEVCKVEIDRLIDAANESSHQLGLWDDTTS